jgi:hypothetical protein
MSDSVKRLEAARIMYKSQERPELNRSERELNDIKNEISILNDENAYRTKVITNATGSPYLTDQTYYLKDVVYNSAEETSWKEVPSYDELYNKTAVFNLKKLNII